MDRTIWYSMEQARSFDFAAFEHDVLRGMALTTQDVFGQTTAVVSGGAATQTTVASLTINVAAARIYQQASADAVAVGAIPQDLSTITQQGFYAAGQITLSTTGIAAGQSRWALVEAQFSQSDIVRAGDPNAGVPPFYNSVTPSTPLNGQGGLGNVSPTERTGLCILQVITGSAATTGSEVPPTLTGGWIPLYLIDLTFGQTAITTAQILTAGPSVGVNVPNNYPYAPFLAGLLSSHHSGNPGQAPKINLATELSGTGTGVLTAMGNATNASGGLLTFGAALGGNYQVFTTSGSWTVPAGVTKAKVTVVGAGGGSGSCASGQGAGGGGAGGTSVGVFTVTPGAVIAVTVGAQGAGGVGGYGVTGGTSSFGTLASATGGGGGTPGSSSTAAGALGGTSTGGNLNLTGGAGTDGFGGVPSYGGNGGASALGGGGRGGQGGGTGAAAIGSGGGAPYGNAANGTNGGNGIVIVEW